MLKPKQVQKSFYAELYKMIPEKHILKKINGIITFGFINTLLEKNYCKTFGRPAKEPEMMLRIMLIQYLYNLSDEQVMLEIEVNLAYKWFIGLNPEDTLPHPSLLAKFRAMRLKEISLNDIITEIVRQCVEQKIVRKENGITIDTTHIEANTIKKVPERVMKHLALKIFKRLKKTDYQIPDYKQIEDHMEAKQVMKAYLENVIAEAGDQAPKEVAEAKAILESPLFIEQKGIRSVVDTDARVGNKSKTQRFYGFKAEISQTTDEQIITGVNVADGTYVDGKEFENLYKATIETGITPTEIYGDKAYFRADILNFAKENGIEAYIPVSMSSYKIDEELYRYNKDSDQWFCVMGNATVKKRYSKVKRRGEEYESYIYTYEKETCRNCTMRAECMKTDKRIAKYLHVSKNVPIYYEYSQKQKSEEFLQKYKARARSESKNAEMKRFHGLARARGYGLKAVFLQAVFTAIAVNLKRIAKLATSSLDVFDNFVQNLTLHFSFLKFAKIEIIIA